MCPTATQRSLCLGSPFGDACVGIVGVSFAKHILHEVERERRMNAEAATSVMIGDNPDADIKGAHDAGWRTIYFNIRGLDPIEGTADAVVTSLDEIQQIL